MKFCLRSSARSQNCGKRILAASCPSECLSLGLPHVRMKQLGSHWTNFHEIWYMRIFRKSVMEIQVSLESDENDGYGYFTWRPVYIHDHISQSFSE